MVNPFGRGKRQLGDNTTKRLAQSVKVARPPTSADTHDPRTGKPFIKGTFWIVDQNPSSGAEGDLYYLKYNDVSSATWAAVLTGSGTSGIDSLTTDSGTALPDGTGDVDILGGTNIATTATGDALTINLDGVIDEANGGTGQSTYSEFDLLIGNSSGGLDRSSQIDTAAQLPTGADADRPGTPADGLIRYSTDNNCVEAYVDGSWVCLYDTGDTIPVDSGGTGATSLDGVLIGNGTSPITGLGTLTVGDLLVGDGDSTPTILGVGGDGQVLVADSGEAAGVKWADAPGNDIIDNRKARIQLWNDFIAGNQSGVDWLLDSFSVSANTQNSSDHPGVLSLQTTTVTVSHCRTSSTNSPFSPGGGVFEFTELVRISTLSDATNTFKIFTGLHGAATTAPAPPVDMAGFTYTHSESSGNWVANTTAASTSTTTDTGVAATTDWVELKVILNAAGTQVTFYIDGTLVATHTTNIFTVDFGVFGMMNRTAVNASAQRRLDMDYWGIDHTLTNSRAP